MPPNDLLAKVQERRRQLREQIAELDKTTGFQPGDVAMKVYKQMISARLHELEIIIVIISTVFNLRRDY